MNMNGKMLPALVLLMMALTFGVASLALIWQERAFTRDMIRASARVIAISPIGGNGKMAAVVEFADEDGRIVQKKAQQAGSFGVAQGDQVDILYTRKKVLGQDLWNVFIARNAQAHPYRLYRVFGVVFGAAAAVLAAVGIRLLLK